MARIRTLKQAFFAHRSYHPTQNTSPPPHAQRQIKRDRHHVIRRTPSAATPSTSGRRSRLQSTTTTISPTGHDATTWHGTSPASSPRDEIATRHDGPSWDGSAHYGWEWDGHVSVLFSVVFDLICWFRLCIIMFLIVVAC